MSPSSVPTGPNALHSPDSAAVPLAPSPTGSPNPEQGLPFPNQQQPLYSQPLGGADDGEITGLGGFPNAHFSRFSQASSMGGSSASLANVGRSESGMSMLVGDGESTNGLYAPVPTAARPTSGLSSMQMAEFGDNSGRSYGATGLESPNLNKEGGFDVAQAEKYASGGMAPHVEERGAGYAGRGAAGGSLWARRKWWIIGAASLSAIAVAVAVAVAVTKTKNNAATAPASGSSSENEGSASASATRAHSSSAPEASASAAAVKLATFGAKGSKVIMADGSEGFTYENEFGGYWGYDAENPFSTNAAGRAQSWSPALNETFNYGVDKVRGVNLGGWLNTEPFIVPALYEKYNPSAVDEWTLSVAMGANLEAELTAHYETFVTEQDFMEIAAAGLNWVRIPIGYWAIETYPGEPFLEKVSWTYFLKAIEWARKYGIRINLDLHAVPGSQNGWNHSGRLGGKQINLVRGQMGIANAQRTLEYIRTLTQFISQPQYSDVVQMFCVLNEPFIPDITAAPMESFYTEVYDVVREVTGLGAGKGPWVVIHDGFNGVSNWANFLSNGDRVSLDTHTYVAFDEPPHTDGLAAFPAMACRNWQTSVKDSMSAFGLTNAGEWSFAINDCGHWVTGVDLGTRWEGTFSYLTRVGSCANWVDSTNWSNETIQGFQDFALAEMDALQNYFFWTWKIGPSTTYSYDVNPMWHYRLGLQRGWAPKDPRKADGVCDGLGFTTPFSGSLDSANVGGSGAGVNVATRNEWPPASFTNIAAAQMTRIPQFTQTGTPITLTGPTHTSNLTGSAIDAGNGWFNPKDTALAYVPVSGCTYPDAWTSPNAQPTAGMCGAGTIGNMVKRDVVPPAPAKRTEAPAVPKRRRR